MKRFFEEQDFSLMLPEEWAGIAASVANTKLQENKVVITFGAEGNFYGQPPQEIYKHAGEYVRIDFPTGPKPE